ncbi:hypothetical protein HDZ31DRAFT_46560 [Schizophyllum fasciatum]
MPVTEPTVGQAIKSQTSVKWQSCFARLNRNKPGLSGLIEFSRAWSLLSEAMQPRNINDPNWRGEYDAAALDAAIRVVNDLRRLPALLEVFLDEVKDNFPLIIAEVNVFLNRYHEARDPHIVLHLVNRVREWYHAWCPVVDLGHTMVSAYTAQFQRNLFSSLPPTFAAAFKTLVQATLRKDDTGSIPIVPHHKPLWDTFELLGLVDRYESVIAAVGYEYIEDHVILSCTGNWEEPQLEKLRSWMTENLVEWMLLTYARDARSPEDARAKMQGVASRFDFHINKVLCNLRIKEIFDIIIAYPDSMGALNDLRSIVVRVDGRAALIAALRRANRKRLLHPGADTTLILAQYVATIRCLRVIDQQGVLLFKVADPIRRYLRERPDTIRCIVANLVGDEDGGDTLVENEPIQPLHQVEIDDYMDPAWEPEPNDAGPEFRTNKPSDVISTLVSIYDSKDLFVKELQVLLAQRLLAINNDDSERLDKERRNIEILKIRFGEAPLQVCEVMMKDMSDSRRTDSHVQSQKKSLVHPTIISSHFWPPLGASDIVMPGQFKEMQDSYSEEFCIFKPDKKLKWLPHLGTVDIELELQDRRVEAKVPPLEAAFIELFSTKGKHYVSLNIWTIDELIDGVGKVDRIAALKALTTWVDLGVLKEDTENTFRLLEVAEEKTTTERETRTVIAADEPAPISSVQHQQAEQMRVYWKFIEGMLTNLGSLSVDRIQSMLKFAPGYDQTIDQLAAFMDAARREGLVVERDGHWKLA